jgi:spermidine synthase
MSKHPSHIPQHQMCRLLVIALCFLLASCQAAVIVHEVRSDFSHIQVVDYGSRRALLFVGESGHQAVETLIDLNEPHRLQHPYARTMMAAGLIYRPDASACLLVGLGGGAIVRFLNHHFPELSLDVVEIDPVVVRLSREYFGTVPGPRTRILIEDGFEYLQRTPDRYDLILMDVHLHPSEQTDRSGQPLHLKTAAFLRGLHARLRPGGVVLFNMIQGSDTAAYIDSIRAAFPAVEIFRPVGSGNVIVVGAPSGFLLNDGELRERARALDRREQYGFSFERLLDERRN